MCVGLLLHHAATTEPIWLNFGMEIDYTLNKHIGYFSFRKISFFRKFHGSMCEKSKFTRVELRAKASGIIFSKNRFCYGWMLN